MQPTDAVDPLLIAALEPVLSDLGRTAAVRLKIRGEPWSHFPGQVTAMVGETDGTGTGLSVLMSDTSAGRVVSVADQVQDVVVEALWKEGRSATWPECPEHPNSHPLRAERTAAGPMWVCPKSRAAVGAIGSLGNAVIVVSPADYFECAAISAGRD